MAQLRMCNSNKLPHDADNCLSRDHVSVALNSPLLKQGWKTKELEKLVLIRILRNLSSKAALGNMTEGRELDNGKQ